MLAQAVWHVVELRKMAINSTDTWKKKKENRERLKQCWAMDLDWSLFPPTLKKVKFYITCGGVIKLCLL